jgi:hypothetical protein
MVRLDKCRTLLYELKQSPKMELFSFFLPFIVLAIDMIILEHAIRIREHYVILLSSTLLILSLIEIIVVIREIHRHYQQLIFERKLNILLDDFILEGNYKKVKRIVMEFVAKYPEYQTKRDKVYHLCVQILETHREEAWEKRLTTRLTRFVRRRKYWFVDDIIPAFIKRFPQYKKYPGEIYIKICQIKGIPPSSEVKKETDEE